MKTFASVLAFAGFVAAQAACPNMCSGKGTCTADDVCQCWKGYEGYDCSQRACPYVESWALNDLEGPHRYSECAGAGICDRSTGTCQCFPGFEGRGCERASCPNGCSGRGKCRMIADLDQVVEGGHVTGAYGWDEKALTACVCDGGYMGPDCSQRVCPHGDDPMTVCEQGDTEQVQTFTVSIPGDFTGTSDDIKLQNSDLALRFTTYAGETFYTKSFDLAGGASIDDIEDSVADINGADAAIATALEDALESVPNKRIADVTVSVEDNAAQGVNAWEVTPVVTFHHEDSGNSYGAQNLLACPHSRTFGGVTTFGCGAAGCQPMIKQPRAVSVMTDAFGTAAGYADASANVGFTADSVVTCGVGVTCTSSAAKFTGVLHIVIDGADNNVYALADDGLDLTGGSAYTTNHGFSNLHTDGFTFLGPIADIAPASGGVHIVDVSSIMPDTKVSIATGAVAAAPADTIFTLNFSPATCTDATDISVGAAAAFENYDIENIECSGRGECDRATGECACFHGYTGLNCGEQTILV